jgi:hypothetical protein
VAYPDSWGSGRSRRRLVAIVGVVAVVIGVGVALLIAPGLGNVFGSASNTANVAGDCATPVTAAATGASSAAPTTSTQAGTAAQAGTQANTAAPLSTTPATTAAGATSAASPVPAAATQSAAMTATAAPTTTAPTAAGATASATATPVICPTATASAAATAAAAAANVSCDIVVPANPLSAQGLATPYQLTGPAGMSAAASGCTMANFAALGAFVQATILNPRNGQLSVYEPLVITQGTQPAAAPVLPRLPRHAIVTIDFGFNGTNLTQVGATPNALAQGRCVDGLNGSIFGQVSFCNGTGFFNAAFQAAREGRLRIPATGFSAKTGQACPTTRDFTMIDQDQSDNVTTQYLLTANGQTAQDNAANQAALAGATTINNGSDNALLDAFLDPTIGCTPFEEPDLSNAGTPGTSQALDELSAARNQRNPIALVPENDEMVLVNNALSVQKTDLYRAEVGQPPVSPFNNAADSPASYCQSMVNVQTAFLAKNQALLATGTTPVPGVGNNLLTFMANRLSMSFANLNCQNFGLTDPITVTLDGNGAATAATFNTTPQRAANQGRTGMPRPGQRMGRWHHRFQDPSGM